jgi:GNAT superfamily N-acetyltransferase
VTGPRVVTVDLVVRFPVDDAVLSALHARGFGGDPASADPWAERLERHALTWVGAFDRGALTGFVQVVWDGGAHAFLLDTVVDPDAQGRGIGSALVAAAVAEARAAGCEWLHVDFEDHLTGFYLDRNGFRPTRAGLINLTAGRRSPSAGP